MKEIKEIKNITDNFLNKAKDFITKQKEEYVITLDSDTTNPNAFRFNLGIFTKEKAIKQLEKVKADDKKIKFIEKALEVNPNAKPDIYIRKALAIKVD